jgi:hypothetical protein
VPVTEGRHELDFSVNIPGRYTICNWYDAAGRPREFSCRALTMSALQMALAAPVIGRSGKDVIAHIGPFGRLQGTIIQAQGGNFLMSISATERQRDRLCAQLQWFAAHQNDPLSDKRENERIVPQSPHSTIVLHDGTTLPCLVIDMSASGAGVSAELYPDIGTPLAVGKVVGRVVRRFAEGFAVKFIQRQDPSLLERMLIAP